MIVTTTVCITIIYIIIIIIMFIIGRQKRVEASRAIVAQLDIAKPTPTTTTSATTLNTSIRTGVDWG